MPVAPLATLAGRALAVKPELAIPAAWAVGTFAHNQLLKHNTPNGAVLQAANKLHLFTEAKNAFGFTGVLPVSVLTPNFEVAWVDSQSCDIKARDMSPNLLYIGGVFAELSFPRETLPYDAVPGGEGERMENIDCIFFGYTTHPAVVPLCPSLQIALQQKSQTKVLYYAIAIPKGAAKKAFESLSAFKDTRRAAGPASGKENPQKRRGVLDKIPDRLNYLRQDVRARARALRIVSSTHGRDVYLNAAFAAPVTWLELSANSGVTCVSDSQLYNVLGGRTVECGGRRYK
uniref:Uncharacterized protein n=1 Tax=viral metagenome TaxID=1070528 RepID=A0A6C0C256_9ZZZZ